MLMYCDHHSSVKLNEIIMNSVIYFIHHIGEFHKRNSTRNVYSRNPVHKYNRPITWTMENFGLMMTEIQQRNFQLQENGVLPLMEFIFALNIFTEAWNHVLVQWRSVWCVVPASYIVHRDLQLKYQIPTRPTEAYKYSFYTHAPSVSGMIFLHLLYWFQTPQPSRKQPYQSSEACFPHQAAIFF